MPNRRNVLAFGLTAAASAAPILNTKWPSRTSEVDANTDPATDPPGQTFPRYVHLPADQSAHASASFEWWYLVGHVTAGDRRFGYEVTINLSSAGPEVHAAITDLEAGQHHYLVERYPLEETTFSTTKLDVKTPAAALSGPMAAMRLGATLPGGQIDMTLRHSGPALFPGGTGLIPFADGQSYYYSLPSLATSGTLTVDGHTHHVRGDTWLDRQWGDWHWEAIKRWTWMAVHLDNGERLNVWDLVTTGGEDAYATVLHRDGHHTIAPIVPVAEDAAEFWHSPTTGQTYPTRWKVQLPGLGAHLDVRSLLTEQELDVRYPGQPAGLYEAASAVTGTYADQPVTGRAYVELYGDWKTPNSAGGSR